MNCCIANLSKHVKFPFGFPRQRSDPYMLCQRTASCAQSWGRGTARRSRGRCLQGQAQAVQLPRGKPAAKTSWASQTFTAVPSWPGWSASSTLRTEGWWLPTSASKSSHLVVCCHAILHNSCFQEFKNESKCFPWL